MAKTKISEFSSTPANNTDIDSINIAEGCAPSNINDAIRELMAQLKDFQTGAVGDSFNGPIGSSTASTGAFTNITASGTLGVTGVATLGAGAILNTPASVTLTNATGLPISTGVSGLGTGVATALAVNVGSAGAPVVNGGALGTPSSGTVTNLTGTASININGTVGATTPTTGAFTTVNNSGGVRFNTSGSEYARVQLNSTSLELMAGTTTTAGITLNSSNVATLTNNPVLTAGTANGVTYLNGSKVLTSGSALTFDGTNIFNVTSGGNAIFQATTTSTTGAFSRYTNGTADHYVGLNNTSGTLFGGVGGASGLAINTYANLPIGFGINGSEQMRLTSTGLGIGTSSPAYKLEVVAPAGDNIISTFRSGDATAANNAGGGFRSISSATATSRIAQMWLDADGANLSGGDYFYIQKNGNSGNVDLVQYSNAAMTFTTNATERARITSGGFFKASNGGTYLDSSASYHELRVTTNTGDWTALISHAGSNAAAQYGVRVELTGDPNGTLNEFLYCSGAGVQRMGVRSNGGIANYSANDVNLSDRREKTNFAPATSYLDKICAIPVQTFNYIDQNLEQDGGLTLGVVAQDVQAVAPELVMESNWADKDEEPKMRLSIYQTDLQYALMKALQELKAEFDAYKVSHP